MSTQPPMQRAKTAQHARSASAAPSTSPSTASSAPASLALRAPLGAARTLRPSHSNGQLAREFQDKHSSTYAHLYVSGNDKENAQGDAIQAKLELGELAMQAERKAARERREAYLKSIGTSTVARRGDEQGGMGNEKGDEKVEDGHGKRGAWRPLSLVAKRQAALGHARSASASTAVVAAASGSRPAMGGIRSVSHTPTSSIGSLPNQAFNKVRAGTRSASPAILQTQARRPMSMSMPPSLQPNLEVVVETETYHDEHVEEIQSEISSRDSATSNRYRPSSYPASDVSRAGSRMANTSTYSWATSFSGETAELRAAAHYVGSDDHGRGSMDSTPSRASARASLSGCSRTVMNPDESDGTPPKIKQRRKRIVTLAHTVRQLEGVGSREPEDPDFYEKLVKAWNERPGVVPVPLPNQPKSILQNGPDAGPVGGREEAMRALTDAPPTFGAAHGYEATPAMTEPSPALGVRSPHDGDEVYTPDVGQAGIASTSYGYGYGYDQPQLYATDRASRATRSTRYSYASTLHDLALEGGYVQGDRLMADKPWMRADDAGYTDSQLAQGVTSRFGIGLGDAFAMPPPAFAGARQGGVPAGSGAFSPIDPGTPCRLNDEDPMESTANSLRPTCPPTGASGTSTNRNSFEKLQAGIATSDWLRPSKSPRGEVSHTAASTTTSTPTRPLRRVEGQVLRYGQPLAVIHSDMAVDRHDGAGGGLAPPMEDVVASRRTAQPERSDASPAWGLGFMSTWWNDRHSDRPNVDDQSVSHAIDTDSHRQQARDEQDFHMGKDGNRSSRKTEMDWKNWTKALSACGDGETSAVIRGNHSNGDTSALGEQLPALVTAMTAQSGSPATQGQPRVLLQGRKRPRGSSWSSGSRAPSASAHDRHALVPAPSFPYSYLNDPAAEGPTSDGRGQMEWLEASGVHVTASRAQTPNSFMTRHSRASRFSRGSRLSGAQTATTSSPMYSYPVSSDSSFSATYPRVLGAGVRAHQRAFSTGSIVQRAQQDYAMQTDQAPAIPLPAIPLAPAMPLYPSRIDFTRTPSDLESRHDFLSGSTAGVQPETMIQPSTSAATGHIAPATTSTSANTIGEGEREFPFSSLCRRPSSSTHSHTSFPPPLFAHHPLADPMPVVRDGRDEQLSSQQSGWEVRRPELSRDDSRQAHEYAQARRAAELGLGPPPMVGTIRWSPSEGEKLASPPEQIHGMQMMMQDQDLALGTSACQAGVANDVREQRVKELPRVQSEVQGQEAKAGGLRGWASSLFPSRQDRPKMPAGGQAIQTQAAFEAVSSVPMKRQSTDVMPLQGQQPQHPAIRPRLSSRPQLSTLRQRPSLTIRLPDADAHARGQGLHGSLPAVGLQPERGQRGARSKKSVKRKSVSPMRVLEADADMRMPIKSDTGVTTPSLLTPAAALSLTRSHSQALSNTHSQSQHSSGPPTGTLSAFSHETLLLPPPATPATPGTPVTPGTPAESSYSMFMGVPLSPLPTPPLPSVSMSAAMRKGDGGDVRMGMGEEVPSVWMTSKSSVPPRPHSSTLLMRQPLPLPAIDADTAHVQMAGGGHSVHAVHQPMHPTNLDQADEVWHPTTTNRLPVQSSLPNMRTNADMARLRSMAMPDYADSSFPNESIGGDDTRFSPVRAEGAGMYDGAFRPDGTTRHDQTATLAQPNVAVAEIAATTLPQPQSINDTAAPLARKRSALPIAFFWLGILMPWFWLIAGWGLASSSTRQAEGLEGDVEKQYGAGVASTAVHADTTPQERRAKGWLYHPDPWCRRSRIAAATVLPGVAVGAVAAVVVLAVLR